MDRDTKKSIARKSVTIATATAGAGALSPLAAVVVDAAFDAISRSNRSRVEELLRHALTGDDAEALADHLHNAFVNDDPAVTTAFVQAARAAMEAIEPAVVPSIGLLFRLASAPTLTPLPRWQLRAYLRTLEEITAEEFRDLRTFVHGVLDAPVLLDEPERSGVPVAPFQRKDGWWDVDTALVGASPRDRRTLCIVERPERVFQVLLRQGLAEEREFGVAVTFSLLRPLASVMPLPSAPSEPVP